MTVRLDVTARQSTGGAGGELLDGVENLVGSRFADILGGDVGNNVLDGRAGGDTLTGGAGDDSYSIDDRLDVVVEATAAGQDRILSSVAVVQLAANVEGLTLIGDAGLAATGNGEANLIIGNTGANRLAAADAADTLRGGLGADDLDGGAGDDSLYGETGNDSMRGSSGFDGGDGVDLVNFASTPRVNVFLDGSGTNGAGAAGETFAGVENLFGSAVGGDFLVGDAGANRLSGDGGADWLYGRAGRRDAS